VAEAFHIRGAAYLAEIDLAQLAPYTVAVAKYQPLPRFPSIFRDLALVMDSGVASQRVQNLIQAHPLVAEVVLFDVYSGAQLPPGKKSLAYRVAYRSPSHTLTDSEVDRAQRQILERLAKELGVTLRAQGQTGRP
jgi:phenylalanyl-tRNA synthetase beta chain